MMLAVSSIARRRLLNHSTRFTLHSPTSSSKRAAASLSTASSVPPVPLRPSSSSSSSMKCRHLPVFFSVAAALSFRTHSTLGDSGAYRRDKTDDEEDDNPFRSDCPFYGCPLLPQDVHYNTDTVKSAFERLRSIKRGDTQSQAETKAAQALLQSAGHSSAVTLTLIGYKGGSLNEQINQDRALVIDPFFVDSKTTDNVLLGVFDGHAPLGEVVSDYTKSELPNLLSKKLASVLGDLVDEESIIEATKAVLIETFVELDTNAPAEESGGCTASVIYKQGPSIYVANAGDSRSFVCSYRPSTGVANVLYISREDKPSLPDEKARVEAAGGQVYIPARGTSRVVYHDPRTGAPSGLAMSRSIGDWAAGKLGVIPNPIVDVFDIEELVAAVRTETVPAQVEVGADGEPVTPKPASDEDDVHIFAVSATDGMMDYLEATDIAAVLAKAMYDDHGVHPITAVEHLVFAAANAWQQDKQGRYRDDIAIAVATLRRPPEPATPAQ